MREIRDVDIIQVESKVCGEGLVGSHGLLVIACCEKRIVHTRVGVQGLYRDPSSISGFVRLALWPEDQVNDGTRLLQCKSGGVKRSCHWSLASQNSYSVSCRAAIKVQSARHRHLIGAADFEFWRFVNRFSISCRDFRYYGGSGTQPRGDAASRTTASARVVYLQAVDYDNRKATVSSFLATLKGGMCMGVKSDCTPGILD